MAFTSQEDQAMAAHATADLYRPDYADLARKFCRLGATDDDLASCFEVAPRAVADWLASLLYAGTGRARWL